MRTDTRKIVLIGTGMVGMSYAYCLLNQNVCDELVLVDINRKRAEGEAMDLNHGLSFAPHEMEIKAGSYEDCKDADIVVLASPLYYWSISGQLKTAFDRLFAVAECDSDYRNPKKECVLIMAAEGHGFEESEYWYDRLEKHLGWRSLGKVLCGGVMAVGDIGGTDEGKEKLNEAYELGLTI